MLPSGSQAFIISLVYLEGSISKLYRQGSFIVREHGRECVEELYRSADSVKAFLDEKITAKDGSRINRSIMFSRYEEYCKENDRQSHGKSVFLRMMKDKGYRIKRTQEGYYFMDVAFKDSGFVELDPEEKVPFEQMKLDLRYKGEG